MPNQMSEADLDAEIARLSARPTAPGLVSPPVAPPTASVGAPPGAMPEADLDAEIARLSAKPKAPTVLQEMHPDFSVVDRAVVKNFSNDPEAAANYLRGKHPNLEIKVDNKGQYMARKNKSDEPYRVLDPDSNPLKNMTSWNGIKENVMDATDAAYDLTSGAATQFLSKGAGLAAAIPTGGLASLPVASGVGAVSGGGLEAARQQIGKWLGVNNEIKGGDVGIAAAAGAASPLVFGSGVAAGDISKKLLKQGVNITGDDLEKIVLANRGGLGMAYDKFAKPTLAVLGEKASGVSRDALKKLSEYLPAIEGMENSTSAVRDFGRDARSTISRVLKAEKKDAGEYMQRGLDQATAEGKMVDTQPLLVKLSDEFSKASNSKRGTAASREYASKLDELYNSHFVNQETGEVLTSLSPNEAYALKKELDAAAKMKKLGAGDRSTVIGNRFTTESAADKDTAMFAAGLKDDLLKQIDEVAPAAAAHRARYAKAITDEKEAKRLFNSDSGTFKKFANASKKGNQANQEFLHMIDTDYAAHQPNLIQRAELAEGYNTLGNPNSMPLSSGGTTSTSRTIGLGALGAAGGYWAGSNVEGGGRGTGAVGGLMGAAAGTLLGGPAAMRAYISNAYKLGLAKDEIQASIPQIPLIQTYAHKMLTEPGIKSAWKYMKPKEEN